MPVAVAGGLDFRAVNAGWLRSCGVTTASSAYCWGTNSFGDLGLGNFDDPADHPRAVLMPAAAGAPAVGWEEDRVCRDDERKDLLLGRLQLVRRAWNGRRRGIRRKRSRDEHPDAGRRRHSLKLYQLRGSSSQ